MISAGRSAPKSPRGQMAAKLLVLLVAALLGQPEPVSSGLVNLSQGLKAPQSNATIANQGQQHHDLKPSEQRRGNFAEQVCIGTSNRISGQLNKIDHYQNLVDRYRNCAYILGNLEITWLRRSDNKSLDLTFDLTFLESIREITGYLLIAYVDVETVRLPNLQIIRGRDVFRLNNNDKEEFAMMLIGNNIRTLELPSLREVLVGSVGSYDNKYLCHINTINWNEILNTGHKMVQSVSGSLPNCTKCHDSCEGGCWGDGPELCQRFTKKNCATQCDLGRCFGEGPRDCCHLFCAGGCYGPKPTDCFACKNFNDDGECIQECPPSNRYNPTTFSWETNPNGKYAYGATCVKECPEHMLKDNSACVRTCPPNKRSQGGECIPCIGPCPKNCQGVDKVHSGNIDQLVNCTVIDGSITILDTSFNGFAEFGKNNSLVNKYPPMHPSRLEVLKTIREITGHLNIQASHPDFKNLHFLRNLRTISGREMTDMFHSLSIIRTSLESLNLRSLKEVRSGKITIEENQDLCFANSIDWHQLNVTNVDKISIRGNANPNKCSEKGLKCHKQCGSDGCWGPGQDECLSCTNYKLDDYCVENCASTQELGLLSYDTDQEKTCKKCSSECRSGCNGTEDTHCWSCKNVKDGPRCVAECPSLKYNDNGICKECDKSCASGCTGPSNRLGLGGCNSCAKAVINSTDPHLVAYCIPPVAMCPEGFYQVNMEPSSDGIFKSLAGRPVCQRCHPKCKSCTGMGTHTSVCTCAKYVSGEQCEDSCPRGTFPDENLRRCVDCHSECNGCRGPTDGDCINCRVYRVYLDSPSSLGLGNQATSARLTIDTTNPSTKQPPRSQQQKFKCTAKCPKDKPHRISQSNMLDPYCSDVPNPEMDSVGVTSLGSLSFLFVLTSLAAFAACFIIYRCQIQHDKTMKLTMHLSGLVDDDDDELLNPSNQKSNSSPLVTIKSDELQRGTKLGEGHSGVVYHGWWTPGGRQGRPVAIKELKDNAHSSQKQFLEEAYIMVRMTHPNLVRLLGVCIMSDKLMLVTKLMPVGGLAEYVSKNRHEIDPKLMLNWCKQIANGMKYLEEEHLVHRDLALRNVLLQTRDRAMISDFGLAKFLDDDKQVYYAGGRRMPIKWLAPECIRERKFTHKSDVWAFGITIWELMTFGLKPFEEYDPKEVPEKIEGGARLPQPRHVRIELYRVLYECWWPDPDHRPEFKVLAETFAQLAANPLAYIDAKKMRELLEGGDILAGSDRVPDCDNDSMDEFESCHGNDRHEGERRPSNDSETTNHFGGLETLMAELTPTALSRQNEVFNFELKHRHSQDLPFGQVPLTPTFKKPMRSHNSQFEEKAFSQDHRQASVRQTPVMRLNDFNNNASTLLPPGNFGSNADSSQSVHNTTSTVSLAGQRVEHPTDIDDYLIPSPCSNEDKFSKFLASHDGQQSRLPSGPPYSRDPPHSAGLIGISNDEYFLTRVNYVSSGTANASSGHIPNSLV